MTTVFISPSNVATFPEGGGHFWVYMQYVQGLRQLGCEVYWLEKFQSCGDQTRDSQMLSMFIKRMEKYGLDGKVILYNGIGSKPENSSTIEYMGIQQSNIEAIFTEADLLLNFHYAIDPTLLSFFRRTALVDIDPGLLQFWISVGQLDVTQHDYYFTIGETVGIPSAMFSDCGLPWIHIRPPICLELWPYAYDPLCEAFTTVSGWWGGGGKGEFITDGKEIYYENNKRVSFLEFVKLPCLTNQVLELALCLGEGGPENEKVQENNTWYLENPCPNDITDYKGDLEDRKVLESHGWRLRHSYEVASSPEMYQSYLQRSRGEFSCAKPSCMKFQNAWVSDRTLCYLASGKPAVVQHTGPSSFLPNGEGMFRFSTLEEAVNAFATINADYKKHCQAAREIAETHFDAKQILEEILNVVCK
jgi:hypothetical protein